MDYPIDYDAYTTEEIVEIIAFLHALEQHKFGDEISADELLSRYNTYRSILNNKAEEKRIDKAFESQTGIAIYQTMNAIKKSSS